MRIPSSHTHTCNSHIRNSHTKVHTQQRHTHTHTKTVRERRRYGLLLSSSEHRDRVELSVRTHTHTLFSSVLALERELLCSLLLLQSPDFVQFFSLLRSSHIEPCAHTTYTHTHTQTRIHGSRSIQHTDTYTYIHAFEVVYFSYYTRKVVKSSCVAVFRYENFSVFQH